MRVANGRLNPPVLVWLAVSYLASGGLAPAPSVASTAGDAPAQSASASSQATYSLGTFASA